MEPYVVFALFILAIGIVGSIVIGVPSILLLRTELKQYSGSRRFALTACCGLSGVATLLLTALWSLSLTLNLAHLSTGPSADELVAWIKAFIGFGLSPGLSLFSAGLTSLCWRRS